ncbi:UvrD-helicase domain-containing protein [Candidatus Pacebacteria bacterium]|nr:UvrD-helicase domain-containing protein [Candidatus Paceibacterota bacterium]
MIRYFLSMDHLEQLNKAQKEAVLCEEGPLLILAGAGAGKTKTLTTRILHLIKQGTPPENILAITFTNKAAKEMRERVVSLIEQDPRIREDDKQQKPFVSTFHALGVRILRENSAKLNVPRHFTIYDRNDSISLVKKILKELGEDPKRIEPRKVLSVISKEKGKMVTQKEYEAKIGFEYIPEVIAKVWTKYESALKKEKAYDFDDLLLEAALLLKNNKEIRDYYQNKWTKVHIDEYQDTNEVQYQIAKMIVGDNHNICVVGDVDQNIYSWRGATIKNIMGFEKDFPKTKLVTLEQNYRSTGNILEAANGIIEKNTVRRKKILFTENESGEHISLYNAFDEGDEARFIADTTQELVRSGVDPSEIAVLYRANYQSRVLEEAFLNRGLAYQVLGTRFFDRKEVKDVLSYIRSALNPSDLANLGRIINVPTRGIGKVTFLKIAEGNEGELSGAAKEKVANFRRMMTEIKKEIEEKSVEDVIKFVLKRSGLEENFKNGGDEGLERLENVKELATLAKKYDGLEIPLGVEKLLEDAALATDQDELNKDNGGTKLMTVHASKGLEFNYVFITGLEEGLFPHERLDGKKEDDEEERRLFYVALTRARQKVYLSYAGIRTIFGSQKVNVPSEFISDIEDHLIKPVEEPETDTAAQAKDIFINW